MLLARPLVQRLPPFVLTSHGGDLFGLRGGLATRLKRWVLRRADAVSVVSRPMAEIAESLGADPHRTAVIPMGVDFQNRFTPDPTTDRRPGEILFVGRLVEKKGLRYLIQALPQIVARIPHAHVTIAGYGPEEAALRRLADELGVAEKVTFLGALPQEALPDLYRRAAVFVAPFVRADSGDQDGFGLVVAEAIACGCPVAIGDVGVLAELFDADDSAARFPPGDIDALVEAVVAVLERPDEYSRRGAVLRARLVERLHWDVIAGRYAVLLGSLLSRQPD